MLFCIFGNSATNKLECIKNIHYYDYTIVAAQVTGNLPERKIKNYSSTILIDNHLSKEEFDKLEPKMIGIRDYGYGKVGYLKEDIKNCLKDKSRSYIIPLTPNQFTDIYNTLTRTEKKKLFPMVCVETDKNRFINLLNRIPDQDIHDLNDYETRDKLLSTAHHFCDADENYINLSEVDPRFLYYNFTDVRMKIHDVWETMQDPETRWLARHTENSKITEKYNKDKEELKELANFVCNHKNLKELYRR